MRRAAALLACTLFVACGGGASLASPTPTRTVALSAPATAATNTDPRSCPPLAATVAIKRASMELAKGGVVEMALRPDKAPNTVATFISKANAGFYNNLTFHRVIGDFVAQGGDPQGTGSGGGNQPTELSDLPFCKGSLGIARGGDIKVSNDSQWFICTGSCRHLDGQYTNFGQVTSGMDVALGIKVGDKIKSIKIG
ncbi:MAG TPA: peptidylprolyl isomerase [Candidatus Limnocylindria bacterium]|nr:peptidylprolyl isomerase [Candidatus Limnocylindria bacterium]